MEKITANCLCCNKIVTDVTEFTKGHIVFCSECADTSAKTFEAKGIPYAPIVGQNFAWWGGTEYDAALNEVPKLAQKFTEKCDHCNKALDHNTISRRYNTDIIWCASCIKEEDTFLTSCNITHRANPTSPSQWFGSRSIKLLKDYPQKGKTDGYMGLTCPCDHCGEALPYKDIPEGYEAPWCESCFTKDFQLLNDYLVPDGAFSKDRKIQAWLDSAPKVKRIPKKVVMSEQITETKIASVEEVRKTSEIVCHHCDTKIQNPPSKVFADEVIWCNTCCVDNEKFFVDNSLTRTPSSTNTHWRKWGSPTNTIPLASFPKKNTKVEEVKVEEVKKVEVSKICCGHCSDEIIDPPVDEVREDEMIWCETCCTANSTFVNVKLTGIGVKNSTGQWRRWEVVYNVARLKEFPKKVLKVEAAKIEDVKLEIKIEDNKAVEEVKKETPSKMVACDHCDKQIDAIKLSTLETWWCKDCITIDRALMPTGMFSSTNTIKNAAGEIELIGWRGHDHTIKRIPKKVVVDKVVAEATKTNEPTPSTKTEERTEVTVLSADKLVFYPNAIKKDDGTIVYAGWKAKAPEIKEIPKKGHKAADCDHCGKHLDVTAKKNYDVYWCNGCVDADKTILLSGNDLSLYDALNYTSEFHGWRDNATYVKGLPKKVVKIEEVKKAVEEVKVETCNCRNCDKSIDRKSIWATDSIKNDPAPFVWCKECVITNYGITKGKVLTLTEEFYKEVKHVLGEYFRASDEIEKLEKITAELKSGAEKKEEKVSKEICACGFCGKSLEKKSLYTNSSAFDFVLCKECVSIHRDKLATKGVATVNAAYYATHNHTGEEFNSAGEIEALKTYLGSIKKEATEKKEVVIHITTNCGHCDKSLDIVAAPNYDIYWCSDCVSAEKDLLHERSIPVESCAGYTKDFIGWKDSANTVKAIGTKADLAKVRAAKAEAQHAAEAERIKSCTTNCDHCNKSIVFSSPVKSNTVEVSWCQECSIENKGILFSADIPNSLCDQRWGINRPEVIAIPKKPNAVCGHCDKAIYANGFDSNCNAVWCADCSNEDYELLRAANIPATNRSQSPQFWSDSKSAVEVIQRKISCAHCGKRVYKADTAGRRHDALVWCKDCSLSNTDFLDSKKLLHLTKNDYEKTGYDGEGWRDRSGAEIIKKVPMKSEKNCTCDHCGATFHDASFEAGMVAWCKDCCGENVDFLKKVGIPGFETESSLEGKVWGLKKNVDKVKLIAKKGEASNDVCDHCGTSLYFREPADFKHIAWCHNCVNKDFSILQSMGQSDWRDKIVNAQIWFDHDDCFEKIKAVPKVPNAVCDHCDKKFFAQCIATDPSREYLSWCQDCCHTDTEVLKAAGVTSGGVAATPNGFSWVDEHYKEMLRPIEKKANATCDHCEKKMRVKPEHLSPDAIYWCNGCAVLDDQELKKHNLDGGDASHGYHSWIFNAKTIKSIAKKSAIVREAPKKVEMLVGQCPCYVCGNATTDYNLQYKEPNRWYNTCHGCSVRISEIKTPGGDTSGITSKGSGVLQNEVKREGSTDSKVVKQAIEEFQLGKKILEEAVAKKLEEATKEIEEIAAKAAIRAAEIKAEIAKKEAEAMKAPTKQTACHCCGTSCPDWESIWASTCESCALKLATETKQPELVIEIKTNHGTGWSKTFYAAVLEKVKKQIADEKEVAATITKMLEVVEITMAKIDAVELPTEKIQEIIDAFDKAIALDQGTLNTMAKAVGSKDAPKLEKLEIAKRVIDALSNSAYPFGGFVRDLYAFENFKDIDFFFPRFDTEQYPTNRFSGFDKCAYALMEKGFTLQGLEEEQPLYVEAHHTKLIKKSYLVTDTKTGISINIDLVRTNAHKGNAKYDTPFLALDADVNSLFFDKKTQTYKAANGYDTAKVIRNIENKVFELANNGEVLTKRINKLTEKGYTPTKNMTIDKTVLKVGDLVSLVISNPESGASYLREATVFSTDGEVRTILSSPIEGTSGNSWVIAGSKDITAVKKVGKTAGSAPLGWTLDSNTKITALHGNVFPPPPALDYKLLNVGDKIEIEYTGVDIAGNKFSYFGDGVILEVGDMDQGIYPIATISKNVVTNPVNGASLAAGANPGSSMLTLMQTYGIAATNVVRLDESLKATKVTGKMELPPIDQATLNIGDKVELEVNLRGSNFTRTDEKVTKTAWVVGITSGVRHFALESPAKSVDGSASPCYYIPDYTEYHIEAKRLGIDCNVRNGWKFVTENTKIRKVLEKAPALIDPLTVEVGDRCEVEIQPGRSGIATCIEKQSNGNPCWAFDKIPGMNLNAPTLIQIPLYQKYGVQLGTYSYWVNEANTKIRKKVGVAENTFIEHKTLNAGDVVDLEIVYSGKSYGTVTGIVAEVDASGRQLLTIDKSIPSLTGTATGIFAHAANIMGWDPALCGTWVLQSNTDKVSRKIETQDLDILPFSGLKVGDLVEVEVLNNTVNFKTEALVGGASGSNSTFLILKNRSDVALNCDANLKKVAEKYGFETESTLYTVNSSIAVIHKALGKANIKSLPPNSLKVGDRIEVCFGHEPATTAVVIQSADESPYKEPIIAFESETNGCWPLDQKQKDLAFKYGITAKKVGRRLDGNNTFVTKVIGRKSLSAGNLKPGDRLKIEFGANFSACTPLPENATVISSSGDTAVVVLDEVYRDLSGNVSNSKFATPAEKELAKKVGVDIADNDARIFAFSNSGAVVIKDVKSADEAQPETQMSGSPPEEIINSASLQTGDRILMEIKEANGDEYEVEATALGVDYNGFPLVFLDEELPKAFVFTQAANIKACEALGFDAKERRGWDLNPTKTKILEILDAKHEIEIDDVRIGDRIQVEFREDDEVLFTKEGIYVGEDETSGLPVVYFTETISVGEEESWQAEKNTVPYIAAEKLGFTPNTDQYMNLDYDIVIRKIVSRSKIELLQGDLEIEATELQAEEPDEVEEEEEDDEYINPYTLEAGDKVEVKIVASQDEDSYITQMATVIDPDAVDGPLLALDEDFDLGEEETKPDSFKSLGKEVIKKAKQLGINPDKKVAWNVDDYTTIIKVLSKATNNSADAQNKEENMPYDTDGEEITMLDMLKADALSAGYRVAANQMTKGVKGALILSMKDKGMDGGKIQAISEMLDTEMGEALISTLLGYGLTYIPGLGEDPRAQTLAEEFRINGIATAGNVIADSLFQHLLPAINSAMASLPPAEEVLRLKKPARKRIATPKIEEKALVEATGGEEPVKAATKRSSGANV